MIEDAFSIHIDRSPSAVFAVLTDFERYLARWAKGPVAARRSNGESGVGARFRITARAGPLRISSPYEVTLWEPPRRFGGHGVAGPLASEEEYVLTPSDGGTELRQSIMARPRGPFRIIEYLLRRQLTDLIRGDLERFRDLAETEITAS